MKTESKKLVPVKNCIHFWEAQITGSQWLMPPSIPPIISSTITYLKAYQDMISDMHTQTHIEKST